MTQATGPGDAMRARAERVWKMYPDSDRFRRRENIAPEFPDYTVGTIRKLIRQK